MKSLEFYDSVDDKITKNKIRNRIVKFEHVTYSTLMLPELTEVKNHET